MRVAIRSSSAAVSRTLEAIVTATGNTLTPPEDAILVIEDAKHPLASLPAHAERLVLGGSTADAIACPIHPAALARLLATRSLRHSPRVTLGKWELDTTTRQLLYPDIAPVALTEKECLLLGALARYFPEAATRETLLQEVWGIAADIDTHTLETHIYRLRTKLATLNPTFPDIITVDSAYRLAA